MSSLQKWNDKPVGRERAGLELAKIGVGGGVAMVVAGLLPFITVPMVFIAMVILGLFFAL